MKSEKSVREVDGVFSSLLRGLVENLNDQPCGFGIKGPPQVLESEFIVEYRVVVPVEVLRVDLGSVDVVLVTAMKLIPTQSKDTIETPGDDRFVVMEGARAMKKQR